MNITTSTVPVRHIVWDDFAPPAPDRIAPEPDWSGWEASYDNDCERGKRTTRQPPPWVADVIRRMQAIDVLQQCVRLFGIAAWPDTFLYGGGLQVTAPGGYLNCHLDGVIFPPQPHLRRAVQLVCFCHPEWKPEWGGAFTFFSPNGEPVAHYDAIPGRMIAFENCDLAYHGVTPTSAEAPERMSVSFSLLADARASDTRRRALFLPTRVPSYAAKKHHS